MGRDSGCIAAQADAAREINLTVSVDSTITHAHQHATNLSRGENQSGGGGAKDEEWLARPRARLPARLPATQRAGSNHKDPPVTGGEQAPETAYGLQGEPVHHAIGHSREGLSSKIHHLVDGCGRSSRRCL